MGTSIGAVAFKVNVKAYDLAKAVKDLLGDDFKPVEGHQDTRKKGNVFFSKSEDFFFIESSAFTEQFFDPRPEAKAAVEKYLAYFGQPAFVLAFEEYDGGDTYSYTLIYEGVVKRQVRVLSGEKAIDFGEPEKVELERMKLEEEELDESELARDCLQDLMLEKIGFISFDMWDHLIEKQYFKKGG